MYPHPKTVNTEISYGTAGFRTTAADLDYVVYRMGLLAVLRARYKKAVIGVVITASHNPEPDNGIKLVDPKGEMMDMSWESLADKLANVPDEQVQDTLNDIIKEYNIGNDPVEVLVGQDTRPSSPGLTKTCIEGILAMGGKPIDFGLVCTPQIHYLVVCKNTNGAYGEPTEKGYYQKLSTAFNKFRGAKFNNGNYTNRLVYDGANGVGAKKIKLLEEALGGSLIIDLYNDEKTGTGKLNYMCGADFVKAQQKYPTGLPKVANVRCCSVDGDADRLIYFYLDDNLKFHLVDGDRMAVLFGSFLKEIIAKIGIQFNLGLVQTAYSNGASTAYITNNLKLPVSIVKTGLKHLHHKAQDYDIGIYFEANGHGTVIFSPETKNKLKTALESNQSSPELKEEISRLFNIIDIINETVGDPMSLMLFTETILHTKGWDIKQWEGMYTELASRQLKITVKDRYSITTTDEERVCVTPAGLQEEINKLIAKYPNGRCFVRASGTEDLVRIYGEATTQQQADKLAYEVARKTFEMAGGTGTAPVVPTDKCQLQCVSGKK